MDSKPTNNRLFQDRTPAHDNGEGHVRSLMRVFLDMDGVAANAKPAGSCGGHWRVGLVKKGV